MARKLESDNGQVKDESEETRRDRLETDTDSSDGGDD